MSKMITIKKDGNKRLKPRDACSYFTEHRDLWVKLKAGEEVEIPEDCLKELESVTVVSKSTVKKKVKEEKGKDENRNFDHDTK